MDNTSCKRNLTPIIESFLIVHQVFHTGLFKYLSPVAGTSKCTERWSVYQPSTCNSCPGLRKFIGLYYVRMVTATRWVHVQHNNYIGRITCLLSFPPLIRGFLVNINIGEIQGAYQIKVTTTALALLISTRHPELSRIEVNGHLVKVLPLQVYLVLSRSYLVW